MVKGGTVEGKGLRPEGTVSRTERVGEAGIGEGARGMNVKPQCPPPT